MSAKSKTLRDFELWTRDLPRAELGGLVKEYVAESNHASWEGFNSRDMTGIRRFLTDIMLYHINAPDWKAFATKVNNTNPVP